MLYPHRCSIYRPSVTIAGSGKVGSPTLGSTQTGVPCYFQTGESTKSPEGFVLGEQDNLFTLDLIHFADTADIQTGDVIKQTTGPQAGEFWESRGDEKIRSQFAQKLTIRATRKPTKPAWVP